jgi:uncharacterized repeat protein (TIGR01451 family)
MMKDEKSMCVACRQYLFVGFVLASLTSGLPSQAAEETLPSLKISGPVVDQPVFPKEFKGNVKDLPKAVPDALEGVEVNPRLGQPSDPLVAPQIDPVLQGDEWEEIRALGLLSDPVLNFNGARTGANPHDPVGDVGPNHYVQMINSVFAIYNKQGKLLEGPTNINLLWIAAGVSGTPCSDNNAGDPIVLYDRPADRWLLSQFNPPQHLCMAVSQTPDPTGSYHLYEFDVGAFPDYFKLGAWPDGYYMSSNLGGQTHAAVFDRANMLNGNPAGQVVFTVAGLPNLGFNVFMPSDLDGPLAPPAGSCNTFYRQHDGDALDGSGNDRIELWEFCVDWSDPKKSTFTGPTDLTPNDFDSTLCGFLSFSCVPQPATSTNPTPPKLDPVNEPPMWRFQYRNFDTHETLVGNFVVDVDGNDSHGIRWFELRRSGGGDWTLFNEGTFAPQPVGATSFVHRWMGSIAIDRFGNIALGYSVSNSSDIFPSIRYTGRIATDPKGLLPQPEKTIIAGGNNIASNRWGDYSSINVDPADDCTFWYTNDYMTVGGLRQTRIATFRFADCGTDLVIIKRTPVDIISGQELLYRITVTNQGPLGATGVKVVDSLPKAVKFVEDTDSCVEKPKGTLICNLGNIAAGESRSFVVKVKVNANEGTITNTAEVSADQAELNKEDNVHSVKTIVQPNR